MPEFSEFVQRKAAEIIKAGGVKQVDDDHWLVTSTSGKEYAVVVFPSGSAVCTCPHGENRVSSTCSHVAAVCEIKGTRERNPKWGDLSVDMVGLEIAALRMLGHLR